jgi:hypothetical protein
MGSSSRHAWIGGRSRQTTLFCFPCDDLRLIL